MSYDEPTPESHQPSWGSSGGDLLASGPVERPRRNVAAIVVSLIAVLAVIGGAAGYVGYHKLASSGSQPDQWAPANSIAYLKLDFDPAASEKVAAWRFEQKFPDAPHVTSADQLKDALLDAVFSDPSSDIDYATDVKPWLGNRIAIAVYPDSSGAAQVVGILAVKDAAVAKTDLTKLAQDANGGAGGAFAIEGDYAVLGNTQKAVDAAVAAAKTSNISASSNYASDVATLKGDRILTGWADLGALAKLAGNTVLADAQALGELSSLSGGGLDGLAGDGLDGLSSDGLDAPALSVPDLSSAGPDDLSSDGPDDLSSDGLDDLSSADPSAPALSFADLVASPNASALDVPDAGLDPTVVTSSGPDAASLESAVKGRLVFGLQLQAGYADFEGRVVGSDISGYHNGSAGSLLGQLPAGSVAGLAASGLGDVLTHELTALEKSPLVDAGLQSELDGLGTKLGIALPGDAINLFGNEVAAGLDSVPSDGDTAKFTVITQPTDEAKGLVTAQKLASSVDQGTAPTVRTAGSDVIISNDAPASGALADEPGFKSAMSGMPDQVIGAAYVDLAGIWAADPGTVPSDLTHLTGIGGYAAIDGNDLVFDARLTVG